MCLLQSLNLMLKGLQLDVPWGSYISVLDASHKDHGTAVAVAQLVQMLVTGVSILLQDCAVAMAEALHE